MGKNKLQESCIDFAKHLLAAGAVWKDNTTYSSDAKEKIPTSFYTNIGDIRISITCAHIYRKGEWTMNCHALNYDVKPLNVNTAEEAAKSAIVICKKKISEWNTLFSTCG